MEKILNLIKLAEYLETTSILDFDIATDENCALGQCYKIFPQVSKDDSPEVINEKLFGFDAPGLCYLFTKFGRIIYEDTFKLGFHNYVKKEEQQTNVAKNIRLLLAHYKK